jgi:hypothetical protein
MLKVYAAYSAIIVQIFYAFVFYVVSSRGAPDIISGRISGPDSEIIELSGIRPDISNIRPDTGYFFKAY